MCDGGEGSCGIEGWGLCVMLCGVNNGFEFIALCMQVWVGGYMMVYVNVMLKFSPSVRSLKVRLGKTVSMTMQVESMKTASRMMMNLRILYPMATALLPHCKMGPWLNNCAQSQIT